MEDNLKRAVNEDTAEIVDAPQLTTVIEDQKDSFFNNRAYIPAWKRYIYGLLGKEISSFSRYFSKLIQLAPRAEDRGLLFDAAECREKKIVSTVEELERYYGGELANGERPSLILLNGNLNYSHDIQGFLTELKPLLSRRCRVAAVVYNSYLRLLYQWANTLGFREGEPPTTFLTLTDLQNLARVSGFELVRVRPAAFVPHPLLGVGTLFNKLLGQIPFFRSCRLSLDVLLRPIKPEPQAVSVSVVVPARNEKGNIEGACIRLQYLLNKRDINKRDIELIFVEGHSSDDTWGEIQRVKAVWGDRFSIKALQQTGKGKSDAVRLGFAEASKELLVILDADLTMPPELLYRFIEAYERGEGDFINGNRLTYPMEGEAMRFLNQLGNIFFAKALSWVLETRLGDSLCGTKLVSRGDYDRFVAWRKDFGEFDPFGDFELLFPAAVLGLGIVDIPIRYRDRTYGSTNIRRFYHGWQLLRMTAVGFSRIRLGRAA